jgi:protein-tyrosine phosphatase
VIDLHSHILPGLDDGPPDLAGSLELARAAVAHGTDTMVATPHIREDHHFDPAEIPSRVEALNEELESHGIPLRVVGGGEVAITRLPELDAATLELLSLGAGPYLLVETPYGQTGDLLEHQLFALQERGFRPVLAHPERSPAFIGDLDRLAAIVQRGVLCSFTAGSLGGTFGRPPQRFSIEALEAGLVHNVASDAHDPVHRGPDLSGGFERLDRTLPGILDQAAWLTREAPAAILTGQDLPERPPPPLKVGALRGVARALRRR